MNKKAEGLSTNVIVIAILALIVLLVVVLVFSGLMQKVIPGIDQVDCNKKGGECKASARDCTDGMPAYGMGCKDPKPYCCYPKPAEE
ncbi:MAG: hypothetical protein V1702_05850 [Candidatus Woesearchaeota archaeon]